MPWRALWGLRQGYKSFRQAPCSSELLAYRRIKQVSGIHEPRGLKALPESPRSSHLWNPYWELQDFRCFGVCFLWSWVGRGCSPSCQGQHCSPQHGALPTTARERRGEGEEKARKGPKQSPPHQQTPYRQQIASSHLKHLLLWEPRISTLEPEGVSHRRGPFSVELRCPASHLAPWGSSGFVSCLSFHYHPTLAFARA